MTLGNGGRLGRASAVTQAGSGSSSPVSQEGPSQPWGTLVFLPALLLEGGKRCLNSPALVLHPRWLLGMW